ncbi:MAG TPA: hypothetical protein PLH94_08255 [Fimbriimonadaceae bacterium]|nr:hypothetical protein [Fimbriimonadaceae bacterium]
MTSRFTVGLEWNPGKEEVLPRATWFVTPAKGELPSFVLGFTSDRLATPEGQAVFGTVSRSFFDGAVTPFVSLKYATANGTFAVPFGANFRLAEHWTLQGMNDGRHTHFLVTRLQDGVSYSFVLARSRYPGMSVSFGF